MAVYVHAPLPGPFTISHRIGGRRRAKTDYRGLGLALAFLSIVALFMTWWALTVVTTTVGITAVFLGLAFAPFKGKRAFGPATAIFRVSVSYWRFIVRAYKRVIA